MKRRESPPYWLVGGSERCLFCWQLYVVEMELRCVACDRGACPHCGVVVWESPEVFCIECHSTEV